MSRRSLPIDAAASELVLAAKAGTLFMREMAQATGANWTEIPTIVRLHKAILDFEEENK